MFFLFKIQKSKGVIAMEGFCDICEQQKKNVNKSKATGKFICRSCYVKNYSHREACSVCSNIKLISVRTPDGKAICINCYRKDRYSNPSTHKQCSVCGEFKLAHSNAKTGAIFCLNCYIKDPFRHETCSICSKLRQVNTRAADGASVCFCCRTKIRKEIAKATLKSTST